ncbi:hypothetical protein NDU88_003420 [Pleurodeles waltl]|uniref:Uncharacterized protein n=1 Tax=Pleurodeles waltl TaxID=8319 RepID=A0AAV7WTK6_PLEWA|nr:hypothetical protein NDU88_003420 [Pleurodeles waltl]
MPESSAPGPNLIICGVLCRITAVLCPQACRCNVGKCKEQREHTGVIQSGSWVDHVTCSPAHAVTSCGPCCLTRCAAGACQAHRVPEGEDRACIACQDWGSGGERANKDGWDAAAPWAHVIWGPWRCWAAYGLGSARRQQSFWMGPDAVPLPLHLWSRHPGHLIGLGC